MTNTIHQPKHESIATVEIRVPNQFSLTNALRYINDHLRAEFDKHYISRKSRLWFRRLEPQAHPGMRIHRYELFKSAE